MWATASGVDKSEASVMVWGRIWLSLVGPALEAGAEIREVSSH